MKALLTMLLIVFSQPTCAGTAHVSGFRMHAEGNNERLEFVLDRLGHYQLFRLRQPDRLVIDLNETELNKGVLGDSLGGRYVSAIHTHRRTPGLHIVLDLKRDVSFTSFVLKGRGDEPDRLVVDLSADGAEREPERASPDSDPVPAVRKVALPDQGAKPVQDSESLLAALEQKALQAPEVLIADAILKSAQSQLNGRQAQNGLQLYGSFNVGNAYDRTVDGLSHDTALTAELGVRYPLLGDRITERKSEQEARVERDIAVLKKQMKKTAALQAVRDQYVDYWANTQRLKLAQSYIQDESAVLKRLSLRKSEGLLLEADRLELASTYQYARNDLSQFSRGRSEALLQLNILTSDHLPEFEPVRPDFSRACDDENRLRLAVISSSPELQIYKVQVDQQLKALSLNKWEPIKSSIFAGRRVSDRDYPVDGDNWNVGVTVSAPLRVGKAIKSSQDVARAALQKFQLQLGLKTDQMLAEIKSTVARYHTAEAGLRYAAKQIAVYREGLREASLRRQYLDGDVIEKLQNARYESYRSGLKAIDARTQLLRAQIRLLKYLPEGCGAGNDLARRAGVVKVPHDGDNPRMNQGPTPLHAERKSPGLSMYVWESDDLLAQQRAGEDVLGALKAAHFDRLLLSLNADQIRLAAENRGGIRQFLQQAHARNIQIDLLLGDPQWILPENRPGLLEAVEKLKNYAFDGLHLDLEPEQLDLYDKRPDYVIEELVHTLQLVKSVSSWPVSMSTHYRNLKTRSGKACLGCGLENIGLKDLTLMIYVANPERVVEIARPIMEAWPGLRISIAQSVEPFLPKEETLWGKSREHLLDNAGKVAALLNSRKFSSVVIQSWSYYRKMM